MAGRPKTRAKREAAAKAALEPAAPEVVADASQPQNAASESPEPITGRPSLYSAELDAEICRLLMDGKTLSAICQRADMPSRQTVNSWVQADPEFERRYLLARKLGAHAMFDEAVDAVRDASTATTQTVQHARNKADALFRAAAKLDPETYSDRTKVDLSMKDLPDDLDNRWRSAQALEAAARVASNARRH